MRYFTSIIIVAVLFTVIAGCKKNGGGASSGDPTTPQYSSPIWYPNGQLLGFNRLSVAFSSPDTITGFWLINKDGSNIRRVTTFKLSTPAWSPDGKWIAYSNGGIICKMAFDGVNFDTSNISYLTVNGWRNFFPSWSPQGDTIYYSSNQFNNPNGYVVIKMAVDGSGQTLIPHKATTPFCMPDKQILHIEGANGVQVFVMDTNGNNVRQITFDSTVYTSNPRYYNNRVYFEGNSDIYSINMDGSNRIKICSWVDDSFSIDNLSGTIAYVYTNYQNPDNSYGTIWLMDANGNNKRQITFN